jgi:hypothetical protein
MSAASGGRGAEEQRSEADGGVPLTALWRAVTGLGLGLILGGAGSIALSLFEGIGFAEPGVGTRVWRLHHANPAGGVALVSIGVLTVLGGWGRRPALAWAGALACLALAVAVPTGQALGANVLGGSAATVALLLAVGGGVAACVGAARADSRAAGREQAKPPTGADDGR